MTDPQFWEARVETVRAHLVDTHGRPICEVCLKPVRPTEEGVWSRVVGYVQARTAGGAHAISEARPLGIYRHPGCHRYGTVQGVQETLL